MFEKGFFIRPLPLFFWTWILAFFVAPSVLFSILETLFTLGWAGSLLLVLPPAYWTIPWINAFFFLRKRLPKDPSLDPGRKDVRVLTLNIFLRPPLVKNNSSDHKEIRLNEFEKVLAKNEFDIIALQEIFALGNSRQRRLINMAAKHGFYYYTRSSPPPMFSAKFIDGGLLILSKFPIVETDAHIYSAGNQIDYYAAKQTIYAKIQLTKSQTDATNDRYLHIFTTHMQASYYENTVDINKINDQARLKQVEEMMEFVKHKTKGSPHPTLVTGDFNVNARKELSDGTVVEGDEYVFTMNFTHNLFGESLVKDLLKEASGGEHPPTYGVFDVVDGKKIPRETVLTNEIDWCIAESIDYLIWVDTPDNKKSRQIVPSNTKLEEFFIPNHPIVTQLSDHYGVSTVLKVDY